MTQTLLRVTAEALASDSDFDFHNLKGAQLSTPTQEGIRESQAMWLDNYGDWLSLRRGLEWSHFNISYE